MKVTPVEGYYSYVKRDERKKNSKKKRKKISDKKTKENDESIKKSTERHFDCYQ